MAIRTRFLRPGPSGKFPLANDSCCGLSTISQQHVAICIDQIRLHPSIINMYYLAIYTHAFVLANFSDTMDIQY